MSLNPAAIEFLESVIYGERKGPLAAAVKGALILLSGVYRAAIALYLLPFNIGLRRKHHLSRPVISVGNITVGGTGKTPTVQYLSEGLARRKWNPAVLSYGYGGSLHGKLGIAADRSGIRLTPDVAGDEPIMLASRMPGIPVLVGRDRHKSGKIATDELSADALVLDDGFQVWKLHRDLDIVLLNAGNPFDNKRTLPAGKLREPMCALRRADCIIATGEWDEDALAEIHKVAPDVKVYTGSFRPSVVVSLMDGATEPLESIKDKRVLALSSIANPASFEETLAMTGAVVVDKVRFPDHHLFSDEDIVSISKHAVDRAAEIIATTEKDAVKLAGRKFDVPIVALRIELELADETGFWEFITGKIGDPQY